MEGVHYKIKGELSNEGEENFCKNGETKQKSKRRITAPDEN